MALYASLGGNRIISANISIPYYGTWAGDIVMSLSSTLQQEDAVIIGNLQLTGFVQRAFSWAGSRSARMVGGYGGWQKNISAKSYYAASGIPLSMVLSDVASEVGEQWGTTVGQQSDLKLYASQTLGQQYVREAGNAQQTLRSLAGALWWIDSTGATRLAPRSNSQIASPFEIIGWSGGKGKFQVATESPGDWVPGRTFNNPVIGALQTVSLLMINTDNDGKLRVEILTLP